MAGGIPGKRDTALVSRDRVGGSTSVDHILTMLTSKLSALSIPSPARSTSSPRRLEPLGDPGAPRLQVAETYGRGQSWIEFSVPRHVSGSNCTPGSVDDMMVALHGLHDQVGPRLGSVADVVDWDVSRLDVDRDFQGSLAVAPS